LDEGCDSLTVNFTDLSSSTRTYTLSWDFGDGSPLVSTTNPSHTFGAAGTYIITLTITNDFDCVSSHQDTVRVYPTPVVDLQADTLTGCVPLLVNFDGAASQNESGYLWDVTGLASFTNPSFTYNFLAPDQSFDIQLIVDTAGFCFDTTSITIETASEPLAQIGNLTGDRFCDGPQAIQFEDQSSSTRAYLRVWDFGDGSNIDTTANPLHVYSSPGVYTVSLLITNDFGCVDTALQTITVYPQPIAEIDHDPVQGCTPLTVDFTNLSQNYSHSQWNFGYAGANSEDTSPTFTYLLTDTTFIVSLIVDTAGFCFDTATVQVNLASEPIAAFIPSSVDTCGPALFRFTNTSQSVLQPLAYLWDFGQYGISSLENPEIFFSDSGTVEVQLIVENAYGCRDSISQFIRVDPQPQALFDGVPQSGCEPLEVQFTDLSTDATHWNWTFEGQSPSEEQNPQRTFLRGTYDVSLVVSFAERCFDTLSIADFISVDRSPVADFVYDNIPFGPDQKASGEVEFRNQSFDAVESFWDLGDGSTMMADSFRHIYQTNDSFEVSLVVFNDLGCSDTIIRTVNPTSFGCLQIPNALAPLAGSGDYNKFWPKGVGLQEYEIAIYTIWGDRVWHSTSLEDGIPNEWWDGTIEGQLATVDVFVWKVHRAVFDDGREWDGPREGTVTLIR
ncbi:MAG: PKD domain-containing protein, partial [Bacteroidota bacterium]